MNRLSALPAKLTRPSGAGLLVRKRLLLRLDGLRGSRCIWISGPAGAGKTSLVSSWLQQNKLAAAWYQVDTGDEDPDTMFHFLQRLAKSTARQRAALPSFTPECLPTLEAFMRRFFERYFALFKPPFVMVFDSCHEPRPETAFASVINSALHSLPDGGLVICMSREEPPPAFAKWSLDHRFNQIGWHDLRFSDAEAAALAALAGEEDAAASAADNAVARGWAAGLRLLLRARKLGLGVNAGDARNRQELFAFFSSEIFGKLRPETRDFLLKTSMLSNVTPLLAQQLCGDGKAAATLEWLHRNQLFTELRAQARADVSYVYHPLFREFLVHCARAEFSVAQLTMLQQRAATLLQESGAVDEAAALWRGAGDWPKLTQLILQHAPTLMMQGRVGTLEEWILAVPESHRNEMAWMLYWLGACRCFREPALGRLDLERAYDLFRRDNIIPGAFLAIGNLIGSYFLEWGLSAPLDRWIGEFESLLTDNAGVIPEMVEAQVLSSLQGIMHRRPDHPMLLSLVERSRILSRSLADPDQRLCVSVLAIHYYSWSGQRSAANSMREELACIAEAAHSNPAKIVYWIWSGWLLTLDAEFEEAKKSHKKAMDLAQQSGLRVFEPIINNQMGATEATRGNAHVAMRLFDAAWELRQPWQVLDSQANRFARAIVCLQRGRIGEAVALAREAALPVIGQDSPYGEAWLRMLFGYILMHDGQHGEAREHLQHALAFAAHMPSDAIRFPGLLGLAWSHLECREEATAMDFLKEAFALGRRHGYKTIYLNWVPAMMSQLCAKALRNGIESDYVRDLIRRHDLTPPADDIGLEEWPWPVRIRMLGHFAVTINGEPLTFRTRAQKKPLELLKALIALGGRSVGINVLTGHLWPDLDGDAAQNAYNVALHRLRRLLGSDDILDVQEGSLSLDPRRAWVDADAFERLVTEIDTLAAAPIAVDSSALEKSAARMLELYCGHFLHNDESPWAIARRDRLRSKFLRAGSIVGARLESARLLDEAVDLYRRELEHDAVAEVFHRGLIRCLKARGHVAEALDAFRRCRDILSITLGVEPSAETQALYRSLKC